jgi:FdrA protein
MINQARVKRGSYFDSITLMQVARSLRELAGVEDAALLMATPANLQLLMEVGLAPFEGITETPGVSDVLIVVRASDEAHAAVALAEAEARLLPGVQRNRPASPGESEAYHARQPHSLEEAHQWRPEASVALISVPGTYAALEAEQALLAGLHVFLFSDNVDLAEEVALKRLGQERGLLVMGPDCGTARLYGVGLGFVNVVPDGPIGLVGASGTGMQQVMCLLAQAGYGISQAIGCGGRDLSSAVGAITTLQGLDLLQEDTETRAIILLSKPPAREVASRVLEHAASGKKPVVVIFVGAKPGNWEAQYGPQISIAHTLTEAAQMAVEICATGQSRPATSQPAGEERASATPADSQPPYLAALFSGGTLCDEALHLWGEQIGPVYSNIPLNPNWKYRAGDKRQGHYALDLGADEYTQGRPHPMIDPVARLKYLRAAVSNPEIGVILLDIVLGYCAHPDPTSVYAPFIHETIQQASQAGRRLHVVVSLCGTEDDPQKLSRQEAGLREAGAEIYLSNAEAALYCLELLSRLRDGREE